MALIGPRSSSLLTTEEMTLTQFEKFKQGWIYYEAFLLHQDGVTSKVSLLTARNNFSLEERSSFAIRNKVILRNRRVRAQRPKGRN